MGAGKTLVVDHQVSVEQWHHLIKRCLRDNTSFKAFEGEVLRLLLRMPLNGSGILEAWAASHDGGSIVRPRLMKYFEKLLQLKLVSHIDVLRLVAATAGTTMFAADRFLIKTGAAKGEYRQCLEAVMLEQLAYHLLYLRSTTTSNTDRALDFRTQKPLISLIQVFVQAMVSMNTLEGPALTIGTELGKYVGVFINDLSVTGVLTSEKGGPPKTLKRAFGRVLPQFISIIGTSSSDVAQSLALLQQQAGLYESTSTDAPEDGVADGLNTIAFQQSIMDAPHIVARASLYIFLNAMLSGRPICDDPALFTFLNSRYNGAVDSLIVDLVTASFDVLGNAINSTEPSESINVYRSFLINKVPVLLESFSHMLYPPITIELCITNAVRSMDPSTDPFSTQTFDLLSSSGMLSEARQEFLFACALYGLIPESSIETILGDVTMQNLPESGKYNRVELVSQCTANPSRIEELVNELENFEGQAAEIVAALVQIIRDCCTGKDSITLKGICNTLSRKTGALDVLLLFEEPKAILQPLCELLDTWQDSEEHSEYQPVYDEFGSIFLLVLIFRQRYDLHVSDLGVTHSDSFIRQYFAHGLTSAGPSDLSEAQRLQLAGWVKGLYNSEGNLSDDPMATCGPKAFHLLVATLFDQSLKANQAGIIASSALQGGLAYFLEPFLLPSLVTGLGWAARRLWEITANGAASAPLDFLVPLVAALVQPVHLSPEAKTLHEAVLATAAPALERALAHAQALHPRRLDIDPLLSALAPRVPPLRTAAHAGPTELEGWAIGTPGGFSPGLRHTLRALVVWSAQAQAQSSGGTSSAPLPAAPQYTHRQILQATRILGAAASLSALFDEARRLIHSNIPLPAAGTTLGAGSGSDTTTHSATASSNTFPASLVIDIVAALVAAPVPTAPRTLLTLRQSLTLAAADAYNISRGDNERAELIVRVERRVVAETLVPGGPGASGSGADGIMADGMGEAGAMVQDKNAGENELEQDGVQSGAMGALQDATGAVEGDVLMADSASSATGQPKITAAGDLDDDILMSLGDKVGDAGDLLDDDLWG